MNTFIKSLTICLSILFLTSCHTEDVKVKTGKIQFNFGNQINGRTSFSSETASVLLSISKSNGTVVHEMLQLTLFSFGNGYVTDFVELPVGEYMLTSFLILDSENNVTYACPVDGSEQSQFVTDPLPIYFGVSENGATTVVPQVLEVTRDADPESFGYVNFGFEIVTPGADSLEANSVQLLVDGVLWKANFVDNAIYVDSLNYFGVSGHKIKSDSTWESVWVWAPETEFQLGDVFPLEINLQMAINVSTVDNGIHFDSNGGPQSGEGVQLRIIEYDSVNQLVSGRFSGEIFNDGVKMVITKGSFNKVHLMR